MRRKMLYRPALVALTAFLTIATATVSVADTITADADTIVTGDQSSRDLGTVAAGAILTTPDVSFKLGCASNKHVDNGQTVTLTYTTSGSSAPAGGSINSAATATIGAIPSTWPDDTGGAPNCGSPAPSPIGDNGNSIVSLTAPTASGSYTYKLRYNVTLSPSGANDSSSITGSVDVTFTLTVGDSTPPVIDSHPDVTAEATGSAGAIVNYTSPGTTDNIDPPGTAACSPASGSQFALGDTTVTCDATDSAGNSATPTTFVVHVVDTTAPVVGAHGDETAEATSSAGAIVTYTDPATSDAVDGTGTATCTLASGSQFALGNTTVTCDASDAAGNDAASTTFAVHVVDTTAPLISIADVIAEAAGPSGVAVSFSVSASDAVDGSVPVDCDWDSGDTFPIGDTLVTCTATDTQGNTGSASFTVTVQDTTAPVLVVPDDFATEATGPGGAVATFTASASDLVDGPVAVTCTPASGSTFPLGTTTVECSAEDSSGNEATGSFEVTVEDTTPPALDLPDDQLVEATGPGGAVATFTASASDLVDGPVAVTCTPASGSTFPLGTTTVECSAEDSSGNEATGSFLVEVVDTTPPVIDPHADETAEATGPAGAIVNYTSPATSDVVDGAGTATCDPASGSTFALGNATVTCTATDAAGNHATATFVVHVVDTTPPLIDSHADVTEEATSPAGATVSYTSPATSDIVDGVGTATCAPASGSTFALGDTTVTCTASDEAGNAATPTTFKVTVQDTTPPTIASHADLTAEATSASGAVVSYTAPATSDAVDGAGVATCIPGSGSTFALGDTTVTCNATDAAGNTATPTTFKVTVVDTTAPTLTVTPSSNDGQHGWWIGSPVLVGVSATDAVSGVASVDCTPTFIQSDNTLTTKTGTVSVTAEGMTTVTCTATDGAGNESDEVTGDVMLDTVVPSVAYTSATGTAGSNGWYTSDVVATFTATDTTSGFGAGGTPTTATGTGTSSGEGSAVAVGSPAFTDWAGNTAAEGSASHNFMIDKTNPYGITWTGGPASSGSYYFGFVPSAPTCTASDDVSGVDTCVVTGYSNAVGPHTLTATATDHAGRSATATRSYNVLAWTLHGFYAPVNKPNTWNLTKNGSTVPLKFEVYAGTTELTDTAVVKTFVQGMTCSGDTATDQIEEYATGNTSLRYDTIGGQFVFNWKTPKYPGTCWKVTMETQDGSSIYAMFNLK